MSQLRSATSLEMEIQTLLMHFGEADLAADALIKKYENEKLSLAEFETLATFLLHNGFCATLTDLIVRKLDDHSKIPWGHFAEAIFLGSAAIETEVKQALIDGARQEKGLLDLARSHNMDHFDEELVRQRGLRRQGFLERAKRRKQDLLQELEVMRSQGLHQEEEKILEKLSRRYPGDEDLQQLSETLRERRAIDFIAKHPKPKHQVYIPLYEPKDPVVLAHLEQIEKSMVTTLMDLAKPAKKNRGKKPKAPSDINLSQLACDFAMAQMIWENEEGALRILGYAESTIESDWLRAEILLRARHFAELLDHLTWLENAYSEDPENVFSVAYLRAQALWGLNQRMTAIEILEGMVQTRPQYRAAHALLDEWKEDLL